MISFGIFSPWPPLSAAEWPSRIGRFYTHTHTRAPGGSRGRAAEKTADR